MTREEQIRKAALVYSFDTDGGHTGDLNTGRDDFMEGAEWADAHPANPWHSIADGDLPKEEKLYLCGDNSDYIIGEWDAETRRFTDPFSRFDNQRIDWVKYWMEIPKLPSERTT